MKPRSDYDWLHEMCLSVQSRTTALNEYSGAQLLSNFLIDFFYQDELP